VLLRKAIKTNETEIITSAGDSLPVYYKWKLRRRRKPALF
jgi:hypothetical protein